MSAKSHAREGRRGRRGVAVTAIALALCCAALVVYLAFLRRGEPGAAGTAVPGTRMWSEELPLSRVVLLFYPEAGGGRLRAVPARFAVEGGTPGLLKSALSELGRAPDDADLISPFKREISVRGVYSREDGTLFVDLGAGDESVFGSGLSEEKAAVGAIANTVFFNFPHVSRLRILIDGEPVSSPGGHLDLSGFLYPEDWLVEGEIVL